MIELAEQIQALRALKDGWMDGLGTAFRSQDIDFVETLITSFDLVKCPYVYPSIDDYISLEWDTLDKTIVLQVAFDPVEVCVYQTFRTSREEIPDLEFHLEAEDGSSCEEEREALQKLIIEELHL